MLADTCDYRRVSDDGRVTCGKIALGDDEVSVAVCHNCPARICDCPHLCFSLQKISRSPVRVRWANGHVEMWNDQPPGVSFLRSACALKTISISSPEECLGCDLRHVWPPEEQMHIVSVRGVRPLPDNVIPFARSER
jgi:hypothetical protein